MRQLKIFSHTIKLLYGKTDSQQSERYARLRFTVPEKTAGLTLLVTIRSEKRAQIPVAVFDSAEKLRLLKTSEEGSGENRIEYRISRGQLDEGAIPGQIPAGDWKLVLHKRRFYADVGADVTIYADVAETAEQLPEQPATMREFAENPFSSAVISTKAGWYNGELHTHSCESTGRTSVEEVLQTAVDKNIDFIALTDHFTASHWLKIQQSALKNRVLCLQSIEVSGDFGHASVHGTAEWINPFIDDNEELAAFLGLKKRPSMEAAADAVHKNGGLFSVNHALSGLVAWRYRDFPWKKCDLFEIWCLPDKATAFLYPVMWDGLLCRGYRLTGVGSSDSHHPNGGGVWELGKIRTWVYAEELSQKAVLAALKKGDAYVSLGEARLSYTATHEGKTYRMGETVPLKNGTTAELRVELTNHTSGNLFFISCGLTYDIRYTKASAGALPSVFTLTVDEAVLNTAGIQTPYFRIEFHEDLEKSRFYGMANRDHNTMRLLSNPIWFTKLQNQREQKTPSQESAGEN